MNAKEQIEFAEHNLMAMGCKVRPGEVVALGRARLRIEHRRPKGWIKNLRTGLPDPDPRSFEVVGDPEEVWNLITNAGRIFLHAQGYGTTPGANGLNWIGLSIDALTETATSTALSTEIAANGLSRAQGTVTPPTGSGNQTVVDHVFTCATAPQAAQKAALFSAASAGTMNHVLTFTNRSLQIADTLQTTFTLTLG